jgi:hypothetical protein
MKVLKPQIDEINAKIPKEKPMERQQATMALYKKVGVSPLEDAYPCCYRCPFFLPCSASSRLPSNYGSKVSFGQLTCRLTMLSLNGVHIFYYQYYIWEPFKLIYPVDDNFNYS